MIKNHSVWAYYPEYTASPNSGYISPQNSGYIDPLYAGYREEGCQTWKYMSEGNGLSFMRKHPDKYRQCPTGFVKSSPDDGWCHPMTPEFEPLFYTEKAFIPKHQYWDGYASRKRISTPQLSSFDMHSIHPKTGIPVVYHLSKKTTPKYSYLPVGESYLG